MFLLGLPQHRHLLFSFLQCGHKVLELCLLAANHVAEPLFLLIDSEYVPFEGLAAGL